MINKIFTERLRFRDYFLLFLIPLIVLAIGYIDELIVVPWYDKYKIGLEKALTILTAIITVFSCLRLIGRTIALNYNVIIKVLVGILSFLIPFALVMFSLMILLYTDFFFNGHKVQKLPNYSNKQNSFYYYVYSFDGYSSCLYYHRNRSSILLKKVYTEDFEHDSTAKCTCEEIAKQNIKLGKKGVFNLKTLKVNVQ